MSQDIPRQIFPRLDKTATRSQFKEKTTFPQYLARIRLCPCLICGRTPSEVAHLRMSSAEFLKSNGRKDRWVTPLCAGHHRLFPDAQHNFGEENWWIMKGIDPLPISLKLWINRDDPEELIKIARNKS